MPCQDPSFRPRRRPAARIAIQMIYAAAFAVYVLWPNLQSTPSVIMIAAAALAGIWLVGGAAGLAGIPRADELLLCGSAAPVLVGLTQLIFRLDFLRVHGGLTRPGVVNDSAAAFGLMWVAEMVLVLLPGILFVLWNARSLAPLPPPQPNRPASASRRT